MPAETAATQKPNTHQPFRHILLVLDWYMPVIHAGLAKYAAQHNWHLAAWYALRRNWEMDSFEGDGVIANILDDKTAEQIARFDVPVVQINSNRVLPNSAVVETNDDETAELASNYLIGRGFRSFAAYCDELWITPRIQRFPKLIEEAGYECPLWVMKGVSYGQTIARLTEQLKQRPKPIACFANNDVLAKHILDAARRLRLSVPDDVAVLGCENNELICESSPIPLSSIDMNFAKLGYEAARRMDQLIDGAALSDEALIVPPVGIVSRASTDVTAIAHHKVRQAVIYIRENVQHGITVDDVLVEVKMSRPGLDKAFRKHLGWLPGEEIRRTRMRIAKRLLTETDQKITTIASACGYTNENALYTAFRREFGVSPGEYRDRGSHG